MKILLLTFIFTTIFLSSCTQDPWKAEQIMAQAQADKIQMESEQYALNQAQNRLQASQMHAIQVNEAQLEYERKLALEQSVRDGWRVFIQIISFVLTGAVAFIIFMGTRATVSAYQTATQGIAKAITQAADLRSRLIYLDDLRQFPAIATGNLVTDITTGATTDTTVPNIANPQQVTGAIANRHVGIVAHETRLAKKDSADNVPLSQQPPIVEAKFSSVRDYIEMLAHAKVEKS